MPVVISKTNLPHESGFTVIEIIIAIVLTAVIIGSGAAAIVSSNRSTKDVELSSRKSEIAAKALERAQSDDAEYSTCMGVWKASLSSALASANAGSTTAALFAPCSFTYTQMRDEDGRQYDAQVTVRPIDAPADGTASKDADRVLFDRYEATVDARLSAGSTIGIPATQAAKASTAEGSLDWSTRKRGIYGTVRIHVCKVPRYERGMQPGPCSGTGSAAAPVSSAQVKLEAKAERDYNSLDTPWLSTGASGVATFDGSVSSGRYSLLINPPAGLIIANISEPSILVTNNSTRDIYVTVRQQTSETIICATRTNPEEKAGFGYEVNRANITMRRSGNAARFTDNVRIGPQGTYRCVRALTIDATYGANATVNLRDPLASPTQELQLGEYDLQVSQELKAGTSIVGMSLQGYFVRNGTAGAACTGSSIPANTSIATRGASSLDRPLSPGEDPSWYGTYKLGDTGPKVMCLQFYTKPISKVDCIPDNQFLTCVYDRTVCIPLTNSYGTFNCPGRSVCAANCSGGPSGTTIGNYTATNSGAAGGPNDGRIGCKNHLYTGPAKPYTTANVWHPTPKNALAPQSTWISKPYLGTKYGTAPTNADGGIYWCNRIGFAVNTSLCCGGTKPFNFGDCIRVLSMPPGKSQRWVQGPVIDVGPMVNWLQLTVAAWRELLYDDPRIVNDYWVYAVGSNYGGWPVIDYFKVSGATNCDVGSGTLTAPSPVMNYFAGTPDDIWVHPNNDPQIVEPGVVIPPSNLDQSKSSV